MRDSVTLKLKVFFIQMRGMMLREHESERQPRAREDEKERKNSPHTCWEIQLKKAAGF